MDPDEALRQLRELCQEVLNDAHDLHCEEEVSFDTVEIAEKFLSIDTWIRKGGFLPKEWKK